MAYQSASVVEVHAWGRFVGAVALDPETGFYAFAYTPGWVDGSVELAPLHMPLQVEPYEFRELRPDTFYRLPPMLADSLPDDFGNALVDAWMAEQGVDRTEITPLDRLAYAADRGMGALTYRPPARTSGQPEPSLVQVADLVLAARKTVRGQLGDGALLRQSLEQLIQVGTSAGGARAKAVIAYHPTTGQIRSGTGPHEAGFEHWLLKLDGVSGAGMDGRDDVLGESAPYGRIEYAYFLMAKAAGVHMSECRLLPEGPRTHFMTRRFDRGPDGERHHFMTLCGMAHLDFRLPSVHSYDQYLATVRELGMGAAELAQAYRRMVFNVVAANRDDHTKNLGFLLRQGAAWALAPAYDVTHAHNPGGRWTQRHQMLVNGAADNISLADLHAVGDRHDVPGFKAVVRQVVAAVDEWPSFAVEAGVESEAARRITADLAGCRPS